MSLGTITRMAPAFSDAAAQWEIKARPDVMIRVKKALPKTESRRESGVLLSDTPENAVELLWLLGRWGLDVSPEDRKYMNRLARKHKAQLAGVTKILSGERPDDVWRDPADHVDEYQYQAAALAMANGGLIVTDELAMGKTYTSLLMLRNPKALPAVIVVQSHLTKQWQEQLATLLPWLKSHIIRSGMPYDPSKKREMKGEHPDVLITSYMKLDGWAETLTESVNSVIFDECQELRRTEAQKTKAAGMVADGARFVMGLSGTPVFNYGGEVYNILDVIKRGCLGEREEFAREWGISGGGGKFEGGRLKVKAQALAEYLHSQGLLLHRTWEEVGRSRPEKPMKLPYIIDAETEVVEEAESNARELAKLILKGGTNKEVFEAEATFDAELRHATGVAKAPFVADFARMVLEGGEKVVIWCWHRAVYAILNERLAEFKPVMYTGSEGPAAKRRSEKAFVEGDAQLLLMSLRSGAGIDGLQKACNVGIFAEFDMVPAIHDQALGRLPRPGQKKPVLGYYLISEIGTDPGMVELHGVKRSQGEPIRNPRAELFEASAADQGDRIRKLAEKVVNEPSSEEEAA
jgi:SNF2 family DNA or RNA helicase